MQNRYTIDDGSEMIFLCNSHRYNAHKTKITFNNALIHKRQAQVWDLQTGERFSLPLDDNNSYTFDLGPAESLLIVFEKESSYRRFRSLRRTKQSRAKADTLDCFVVPPRNDKYCDLSDNWDVNLCHSLLHDTTTAHFDTLFDLKDSEEYQNFCGTIVYRKTIDYHSTDGARTVSTILDLGLVEGVSEVFVNGQSVGVQYFGRRLYDLTNALHEGQNDLEVHVTTTMGNYLKTITREDNPTTWIYVNHPRRDQPLQPMGLLGPVKIYKTDIQ
jgi:hypothetical protein